MKNILLCDNAMVIGGVETVILNQITAFTKKGYNVYVVAGKGIYSDKVEELGGHFIECEFPEENDINTDRINKIVEIIKDKQITEIHIHKYQCILSVMPAALITGVPYFAYDHGIKDTSKYYTWNFPIYKIMFPIYFRNAYKIITITSKTIENTKNEYNVPKEKYKVIHNGIDFDIYKNDKPKYEGEINKVLVVSRITEEKINSIFEAVDIFKRILENYPKAKLEIIGDGSEKNRVEEYLKNNELEYGCELNRKDTNVYFLGEQNDIMKYLKEADLLLGVDRCVLESIAMKVPAVITGYNGIKGLVTKENIDLAIEENFSGNNMNTISVDNCLTQIIKLATKRKEIVEKNYEIAIEKLDCNKNYINIPDDVYIKFDWINLFKGIKKNTDLIEKQSKDIKGKYEWIQKIEKENKELYERNNEIDDAKEKLQEENKNLKKELNDIYNSKRWRYTEKISKFFHKK